MEANVLIGCVGAVMGMVFAYLSMLSRVKGETKKDGIESGQLRTDIEYIKRRSDDTFIELRELNKTIGEHADRLARVEESTKSAHKRLDEIERRD